MQVVDSVLAIAMWKLFVEFRVFAHKMFADKVITKFKTDRLYSIQSSFNNIFLMSDDKR